MNNAHATPTTTTGRFNDDGVANALGGRKISFGLSVGNAPADPGTQGTPALIMAFFAETLSPINRIDSGLGPINAIRTFQLVQQNPHSLKEIRSLDE